MNMTGGKVIAERQIRAMVVDDDPSILFYIRHILEGRGYEVQTYESPVHTPQYKSTECPCRMKGGCPDIIISDFNMPVLNGAELLDACKQKGCRCRYLALILGNRVEEDHLMRLAKYGTRFFQKPLDLDDVHGWLDRVELDLDALRADGDASSSAPSR